jgi:N-acetylmuramoyl-L-alanine amidase
MISAITCIAVAIYFEARGEPEQGQRLVAETILNRATDLRWPPDPCDVITQPNQFSFYNNSRFNLPKDLEAYTKAVLIAQEVIKAEAPESNALYFHNTTVRPSWRHYLDSLGTVGNHTFYTEESSAPVISFVPIKRPQ